MPSPTAADLGRDTRTRLLAAATELIVENGWGAVSTRTLAARAGVPAGAVHYHFASLPALLTAAVVPPLRVLVAGLAEQLAQARDIPDGIHRLAVGVGRPPDPADAVLMGEVLLRASRDPLLRAEVAAVLDELRTALADWLRSHGLGERAGPVATVLAAAIDALGLHLVIDPALDLAGVEPVLMSIVDIR